MQNPEQHTATPSDTATNNYELHLTNVLLEKFQSFLNTKQKSSYQQFKGWISDKDIQIRNYFFNNSSNNKTSKNEHTPLLKDESNINSTSLSVNSKKTSTCTKVVYGGVVIGLLVVAAYSAELFDDDSKEAGNIIANQVKSVYFWLANQWDELYKLPFIYVNYFAKALSWLTHYSSITTNVIVNPQVMYNLINIIKSLYSQSSSEKALTGAVNAKPWVVGGIMGIGSELPFSYLEYIMSHSTAEKVNAVLSSIAGEPINLYGGYFALLTLWPHFFGRKVDDTRKKFTSEQCKALDNIKNTLNGNICLLVDTVLDQYMKKNSTHLDEFQRLLNEINSNKNDTQKLKNFFKKINENKATHSSNPKKIIKLLELAKKTGSGILLIISITMIINDTMTAAYAGYDALKDYKKEAGYILAALTGVFTAFASSGFAWAGFKSTTGTNVAKRVLSGMYVLLVSRLIGIALFSGGPSALEGYQSFQRFFSETLIKYNLQNSLAAKIVPLAFGGVGEWGGVFVNTTYCLSAAQSILMFVAEQCDNEELKKVVKFTQNSYEIGTVISEIKLEPLQTLLKNNTFGDYNELHTAGVDKQDLDSCEIPNTVMIYQV